MDDYNKSRRIFMWWTFAALLISIPLYIFIDNKQLTEDDLVKIENLILSENSVKNTGGKNIPHSIDFKFTNTERGFHLTYEEYQCVTDKIILANFKKGDTVSIKISKSDKEIFFTANWFNRYSKIYGLSKNGNDYLSLACRNQISTKWTNAATTANIVSAILAFFFAMIVLKPKTKYQAFGQFPLNPFLAIAIVWLIFYLTLK